MALSQEQQALLDEARRCDEVRLQLAQAAVDARRAADAALWAHQAACTAFVASLRNPPGIPACGTPCAGGGRGLGHDPDCKCWEAR